LAPLLAAPELDPPFEPDPEVLDDPDDPDDPDELDELFVSEVEDVLEESPEPFELDESDPVEVELVDAELDDFCRLSVL